MARDSDDPLGIGTSLAFPPRPDGRGGFALVKGIEALENHFEAIISAKKGTHTYEPWMGLDLSAFKHDTPPDTVSELVREAIVLAEDRIDHDSLVVEAGEPESGRRPVRLTYKVKGDDVVRHYDSSITLDV